MELNESSRTAGENAGDEDARSGSVKGESKTPSTPSARFIDERSRLEYKIEKLREEITRNSITREGDIEEYLKITSAMKNRPENPQMARIRQHFEKKNRKYTQETEQLQKKLESLEQRLIDLENGVESPLSRNGVLHNVGHEIRRNLKEMTGNVISAPFDIAQKVKKNVFGSADNIATVQEGSNVGMSTFYDENSRSEQNYTGSQSDRGGNLKNDESRHDGADDSALQTDQIPRIRLDSYNGVGGAEDLTNASTTERIHDLKQQNVSFQKIFENFKKETENEIRNQQAELVNSRFKIQHLEHTLNETMELHQNEVKQLKNDLNLIGARMDYQYNDRFKKIEEAVEAAQNRIYRMETSWHENSERLLGTGQSMWNVLMLSGANIVVEILKITLYIISVVLDSIKPLTGTRKSAGFALVVVAALLFLWNIISSFYFSSNPTVTSEKPMSS